MSATSLQAGPTGRVGRRVAALVLAGGLALSAVAAGAVAKQVADDRAAQLEVLSDEARSALERRVSSYAEPLYGMRAVLSGPRPADRSAFHRYVDVAGPARRQGLVVYSFARLVPAAERGEFEQRVRADTGLRATGNPGFSVEPATTGRDEMLVVDFIEPLAGNERAFGFDVLSDPVRAGAALAARDSGALVATAPVDLVQPDRGLGFLLFLPVYDTAALPVTAPARRRHFAGVVTAVVELDDMLAGAGLPSVGGRPQLDVRVEDVGRATDAAAGAGTGGAVASGRGTGARHVLDMDVGGRRWRLETEPGAGFPRDGAASRLPLGVGLAVAALTAMLAGLLLTLANCRSRAIALAAAMTASLRERDADLENTNRRLADTNESLARADRVKDAFLGSVSHQLRTPLATIAGFAQLLRNHDDDLDCEERRESLVEITRGAETLGRLVDDILVVAEQRSGPVEQ